MTSRKESGEKNYSRCGGITIQCLLLLGGIGVGIARAVVVAGHDVPGLVAETSPVVRGTAVELGLFGAQAGVDDAVYSHISIVQGDQRKDSLRRNSLVNLGAAARCAAALGRAGSRHGRGLSRGEAGESQGEDGGSVHFWVGFINCKITLDE